MAPHRLLATLMALAFLSTLFACPAQPIYDENISHGLLCFTDRDDTESQELEPSAQLALFVAEECYDMSRDPSWASCSVSVDDREITIRSTFSYLPTGEDAPDVCGSIITSCDVSALPEGTYIVSHGSSQRTLTIPSEENLDCDELNALYDRTPEPVIF